MEPVSQERICKANALHFMKERECCNNTYSELWSYKHLGVVLNPENDKFEFECDILYKDIPICYPNLRYVSTVISANDRVGESIIGIIVKQWKNIKNEDENENDTIAALILGIMRLEKYVPNYLVIHEAIVSPQHYDIETKRNERALKLGMSSDYKLLMGYDSPYTCNLRSIGINWLDNIRTSSVAYIVDKRKETHEDNCDMLYKHLSLLTYK